MSVPPCAVCAMLSSTAGFMLAESETRLVNVTCDAEAYRALALAAITQLRVEREAHALTTRRYWALLDARRTGPGRAA